MRTAIKTKKARLMWDGPKVTVYDYGDKDDWGLTIWFDAEGNAYWLRYARLSKQYCLIPRERRI